MLVRALATICLLGVVPAHAADGCAGFAWPVSADLRLLSQADRVISGETVGVSPPRAYRVQMTEAAKADFAAAPGRPFAPGARAGTLRFLARAGLYQFTMADRIGIDLVQDGRTLPAAGVSSAPRCLGARRSVRFVLSDGPALIQLSGARSRTAAIAVTRDPIGASR